ncbi:unnamed protein product [Boreogadus saida]
MDVCYTGAQCGASPDPEGLSRDTRVASSGDGKPPPSTGPSLVAREAQGRRRSDRHRHPSAASLLCSQPAGAQAQPPLGQPASTGAKGPILHEGEGVTAPSPWERVALPRAVSSPPKKATATATAQLNLTPTSPATTPSDDTPDRQGSIPGLQSPD